MGEVWAIVVAAGSGSRFGGRKQYEVLGDRPVLRWSTDTARKIADGVVLVVPPDQAGDVVAGDMIVAGGATRSDSVRRGLSAVPESAEVIVVHDAARPFASADLFAAVVAAATTAGISGAVPGLPVSDTVKQIRDARVVATLDRADLVAVQTPQAFVATALREAHESGSDATDDAALVEALGGVIAVVPGEAANRKLTTAEDLAWARSFVGSHG